MPQSAPLANRGERMKVAYEVLHERTGSQGRLRHVQCLELGEWNSRPSSRPSLPLIPTDRVLSPVIKALQGLPTLDPIFVGQPSGST